MKTIKKGNYELTHDVFCNGMILSDSIGISFINEDGNKINYPIIPTLKAKSKHDLINHVLDNTNRYTDSDYAEMLDDFIEWHKKNS